MGETLEDGVDLGQVTGALQKAGIGVLDSNGKMREVGDIMEDLMGVWSQMDQTQKAAIATTLAGKYQLSRFEALMNRSDLYNTYKQSAQEGKDKGTLDVMNEKYAESLEGRLNKLQASFEGLFNDIFNTTDFNPLIDGLTTVVDLMNQFVNSIGGGATALTGLGAVATRVFSNSMAKGIVNSISNREATKKRKENQKSAIENGLKNNGIRDIQDPQVQELVGHLSSNLQYSGVLSNEQQEAYNQKVSATVELLNKAKDAEKELYEYTLMVNSANKEGGRLIDYNEEGIISTVGYYERMRDAKDSDKWAKNFRESMINAEGIKEDQRKSTLIRNNANRQISYEDSALGFAKANLGRYDDETWRKMANRKLQGNIAGLMRQSKDISSPQLAQAIEELQNAFTTMRREAGLTEESLADLEEKYKRVASEAEKAASADARILENENERKNKAKGASASEIAQTAEITHAQAQGAIDELGPEGEGGKMKKQVDTSTIINAASAVGDLAFAWQSFQELGSLWNKDDISTGEKIVSTIQNVAMSAPMAAVGLYDIATALKAVGVSIKALSVGGGILAVITAIAAGISIYKQRQEALYNEEQEDLQAVKASADEAVSAVSSWETLYQAYAKTGEASDEFKQSSIEVANQLGVEGAAALEAAGNYDVLAKAIKDKKDAELQKTIDENRNAITSGELSKSINGTITNGSLQADRNAAYSKAIGGKEVDSEINDVLKNTGLGNAQTPEEMISATNAALTKFSAMKTELGSLEDYTKDVDDVQAKTDEWYQKTESLNRAEAALTDFLNQQDLSDYSNAISNMASARTQQSDFISKMKSAGNDIDKIQDLFWNDSGTSSYMKSISSDYDKQLEYMINASTDKQQQIYLQAQQAMKKAAEKARNATGSDEQADEVYKKLNSSGLTNEQKVTFVASLDENETFQNFDETIQRFKDSPEGQVKLSANIDTQSLDSAIEEKQTLQKLVDSYQENGNFSEDEVASLIKDNPEYLDYLTKVGDKYQLNTDALNKWNEAVKNQTQEIEDAQGMFNSNFFDDYQSQLDSSSNKLSLLGRVYQENSTGSDEEKKEIDALQKMSSLGSTVRDISQQLEDGKISVEDYFSSFDEAFDSNNIAGVFSDIKEYSAQGQEAILEMASTLQNGLANGVNQATKQLKSGNISLTDYSKILQKATDTSIDYQAGLKGLKRQGKQWINVQSDMADGQSELTKEQQEWVDSNKDIVKSLDDAEAANGMNEALSDNYDYLSQIIDEYGNLTVDWDSIAGTEQFSSTVSQMADGISQYISSSQDNLTTFAAAMGMTTDEFINNVGTSSSDLAAYMSANEGNFSATTQAMMTSASSGIGQLGAAAGQAISALGELISGFEGSIEVTPSDVSIVKTPVSFSIFDHDFSFDVPLPSFSVNAKGSLSGGSADAAATLSSSLSAIGSGISGLTNVGGAMSDIGLSDWKPGGSGTSAVPSSAFTNPGGRGSGGGSGGSGCGGGGGGGGSDNADDSQKDYLEDELDLYERVNTELSKMEKHLDGLDQEYDRLIGYNKANNMNQQINDYMRLIDLAKQKLEIQKQEASDLQGKLSGYGVQFNEEGIITNYAQIFNQLKDQYNSLVDQYNASTDKAYKETLSDQMDISQKSFDKFKDYIDRYDTLIGDEIKSSLNQIEEYYDKIEDLRIQAFNDAMDAVDNIQDLNDTMSELKGLWTGLSSDSPFRKMVEDASKLEDYFNLAAGAADKYYDTIINDYKKAAEQATDDTAKNFALQQAAFWQARKSNAANEVGTENGTGLLDMRLSDLEAVLKYFNGTDEDRKNSIWGDNEAAALEALETAYKNLAQAELDAAAQAESLLEDIIDGYEEIGDEFDKMAEAYENLTDTIDHYSNMVESLYGEEDYDRLLALMETKQNTLLQNIRFQQNQVQYWEQELAKYDKETEREKWEEVHSQLVDAQQDLNDLAESAAENLADIYSTQTDKFLSDWKNKLLGGDADFAEMQWELSKKNAELYLDDVERAYNIEKLRAKYQQMLNNTTDTSIQRQIADAMNEQVSALQERVKLSQYDVDYANAQLEILQKRIALEEAQRNKSQMKLKRDAQGNYSYVYTANKDNVDNAQSDLLDSEQNAYELTKNNAISLQENYFSALNDYAEKARQIREKNKGDEATMKEQLQALWDSYKEYLTGLAQQLGVTQADMIESVRQMSEDSQGELSDYYTNIADAMNTNWAEAMDNIGISTSTTVISQLQDLTNLEQATNDLMNNFNRSAAEYGDYVNKIEQDTQTSYGNVGDLIDGVIDKQKSLTDATEDFWNLVRQDTDQINKNNAALISYREEIEKLQDSTSKANQAMREAQQLAAAKEQEARDWESKYTELKTAVDNGSYFNKGGGGSGGGADEETAYRIANSIWGTGDKGGWYDDPDRSRLITERFGYAMYEAVQSLFNSGYGYNWIDYSKGYEHYDTGGYTGSWDDGNTSNGRFAMLHQKELVLNEVDTQNILDAVSLVRQFTKQLKSDSLGSLLDSWMGSYSKKDNEQTVKQDVHITAEFPNVNSATEIETALESLNQRAYQYVQKYR